VLLLQNPVRDLADQGLAVLLTDGVADAVTDDGPRDPGDQHGPYWQLALVGEHPTEQHPDLPRHDEADEGRRLQGWEREDQ